MGSLAPPDGATDANLTGTRGENKNMYYLGGKYPLDLGGVNDQTGGRSEGSLSE